MTGFIFFVALLALFIVAVPIIFMAVLLASFVLRSVWVFFCTGRFS